MTCGSEREWSQPQRARTLALAVLVLALWPSGCCLHLPKRCCDTPGGARTKKILLHGDAHGSAPALESCVVSAGGREWKVWSPISNRQHAAAPVVIILHEMPCLSAEALQLAQRLSARGFVVRVPLLFGSDSDDPNSLAVQTRLLTFPLTHPEWKIFASAARPVTGQIAALCRSLTPPGGRIGVIGLCVSGNLPLQLLGLPEDLPQLVAPVLAQRSLPFGCDREAVSGLSPEEESRVRQRIRARRLQVLGFRFELDRISPAARFTTLGKMLDDGHPDTGEPGTTVPSRHFIDRTLPARDYVTNEHLTDRAHATLTDGYRLWEPGDKSEPIGHRTYRRLTAFLDAKLMSRRPQVYREPPAYPPRHAPVLLPEERLGFGGHCPRPASTQH